MFYNILTAGIYVILLMHTDYICGGIVNRARN